MINFVKNAQVDIFINGELDESKESYERVYIDYEKHHAGFERIPIDKLRVDRIAYQRDLRRDKVDEYKKKWNRAALGMIIVSKRVTDGETIYFILDGQHRWTVAMEMGMKYIDCIVFVELTVKQEAKLFIDYNNKISVPSRKKTQAEIESGDPITIGAQKILKKYKCDFSSVAEKGFIKITAEQEVKNIYGAFGDEQLESIISTLYNSFGDKDKNAFNGNMLKGLNMLFYRYGKMLDMKRVCNILKEMDARTIMNDAQDQYRRFKKKYEDAFIEIVALAYNHKLKNPDKKIYLYNTYVAN